MKYYLTAPEVAEILGVSAGKAYSVIKSLNNDLKRDGYITVAGKVPRRFFESRFWGGLDEGGQELETNS